MQSAAIAEKVRSIAWYHSIELPGGIVTPGVNNSRRGPATTPKPRGALCSRHRGMGWLLFVRSGEARCLARPCD